MLRFFFLLAILVAAQGHATVTINTSGTVIEGQVIDGSKEPYRGDSCLSVFGDNITIRNNTFKNCLGNGGAINPEGNSGLVIDHNTFENSSVGVYFQAGKNNNRITNNTCHNINGPGDQAGCVKLNGVTGSGNVVSGNIAYNDKGYGNTEDIFSAYNTHGTQASPVIIENNCINGSNNTQGSGTGFQSGDGKGDWIIVRNNIAINSGNGAISVAGGQNISLLNNKVLGRGLPSGEHGQMFVGDFYGGCSNITVQGNQVDLADVNGTRIPGFMNAGDCANVSVSGNNWSANLAGLTCEGAQSTATPAPAAATPAPAAATPAPAAATPAPAAATPAPAAATPAPAAATPAPAAATPAPAAATPAPAAATPAPAAATPATPSTAKTSAKGTSSSSNGGWWRRVAGWFGR